MKLAAAKAFTISGWTAPFAQMASFGSFKKPRRFRAIRNPGDPIPQSIGLQFNPDEFLDQNLKHHDFVKCYVAMIRAEDLTY